MLSQYLLKLLLSFLCKYLPLLLIFANEDLPHVAHGGMYLYFRIYQLRIEFHAHSVYRVIMFCS